MKNFYIGIDPSLNSSGISCLAYEDNEKIKEFFFIVQPKRITKSGSVLTKKEIEAEEKYINTFSYILYDKLEADENNHINEYNKTINFINILNIIKEEISKFITRNIIIGEIYNLYICQEGISYGSAVRTKSVFDLAGLNFLLRNMVISKLEPTKFIIATPAEIKKKTSGNGNCPKEVMINLFKGIYPDFDLPKLDDIADSFWMANYVKNLNEENLL